MELIIEYARTEGLKRIEGQPWEALMFDQKTVKRRFGADDLRQRSQLLDRVERRALRPGSLDREDLRGARRLARSSESRI